MLTALQVFNNFAYLAFTEVLDQQINLFNAASRGAITLKSAKNTGDIKQEAFWKKLSGVVRRRDPEGNSAISGTNLEHLVDVMIRVAAGTVEIEIDPGQFAWIGRSPEEAGAVIGRQLVGDALQDMLNTSIGACYAALAQNTSVVYDGSAATINPTGLVRAAGKFGDRASAISAWIMHSKVMTDLWVNNLTNAENLFRFESISISSDPFGRLFVISDCPQLVTADGVSSGIDKYHTLGLAKGAINIEQNDDYYQTIVEKTGFENIKRALQAEWSWELGLKGYKWNTTSGGTQPTTAALLTAANWVKNVTSNKDVAGVVLETR